VSAADALTSGGTDEEPAHDPDQAAVGGGPFARLGRRLPDGLADAVWLWLLLRLGLTLIAAFVVLSGQAEAPCPKDAHLAWLPGSGAAFPLLGAWHHWDACWYTTIASAGYGTATGTGATTFFPFLPLVAGALAVVRGNLPLAFAAVNAVALVLALTGLQQLVARDIDRDTARRAALYVVVFPAALFLIAPFTEAIFLAAVVWAFVGARSRRWEIAIVAGVVAGLTRPLGIVLMLPLAWEAARMVMDRWQADRPRFRRSDVVAAVAVIAPGVAYAAFVAWTALDVGQSYFASNAGWGGHHLVLPWDRIAQGVAYGLDHGTPAQLVNAAGWVLFAVLTIAGIRLLPLSYTLFVLPQLVLALTQDTVFPLMSTSRYLLALFPCFVVLAIAGRRRRFDTSWLVLSTLLLAFLTIQFVEGWMVG
jgi:hypothetical protein